ncbi:uncharacterized protein [Palaemon carinicauda]|uniref:uncharacterized protein n=1 Tax=Palaemon carinicauda TaxID=392227 RepID=UPI0035B64D66
MMKLALILVLFAAASITSGDRDRKSCATNDQGCQCEKLLGGRHGLVGGGGDKERSGTRFYKQGTWSSGGGKWANGGGGWGGKWKGRRSVDENEEEIEEQQVQEREKRHSVRGGKKQEIEACATKTGITITTPSPSEGTKPQLPDEIRNCLIETRLTDKSMVKDSVLDQTALITALTQKLSNNRRVTLTADQVSAITGQVPQCDETTASSPLRYLEFEKCMVNECKKTLTTS